MIGRIKKSKKTIFLIAESPIFKLDISIGIDIADNASALCNPKTTKGFSLLFIIIYNRGINARATNNKLIPRRI